MEGEGKWRLAISGRVDSRQGEGVAGAFGDGALFLFGLASTSVNQIDNR